MRNERRYLSTRFCSFCSKCAVRFPQKTRLQLRVSLNSDEKAQKEKRHLFQKSKRYCEIRVRLPHFFSARCFHFPICLFVSAKGLPKSHGCFPEDRDGRALLRKTTGSRLPLPPERRTIISITEAMTHRAPKVASVQPIRTKRNASPFTRAEGGKEKRTSTNAKSA